jgi:hypothetical protein
MYVCCVQDESQGRAASQQDPSIATNHGLTQERFKLWELSPATATDMPELAMQPSGLLVPNTPTASPSQDKHQGKQGRAGALWKQGQAGAMMAAHFQVAHAIADPVAVEELPDHEDVWSAWLPGNIPEDKGDKTKSRKMVCDKGR